MIRNFKKVLLLMLFSNVFLFSTKSFAMTQDDFLRPKMMITKDASNLDITETITQYIIQISNIDKIINNNIDNITEIEITEESGILYATTCVNIRKSPDATSLKLGVLEYAQEIEYTGICENGWTRVKYNDECAYINSSYLSSSKPEEIEKEVIQYSGVINKNGNISDKRLQTIQNYYNLVPENIRTKLESDGWTYICSNEKFGANYGINYSILALTVYADKIIYIDNRKSAEDAIIHEVGHALDYTCGFVSSSQDFQNAFNNEKDVFCSIHSTHENNTSITSEYFAEFFSVMVTSPDSVKESCPLTYTIIQNSINSL